MWVDWTIKIVRIAVIQFMNLGWEVPILPYATNRFFLFDAPQLALGNKPALAAYIRQNFALHHLFLEATNQLFR